MNSIMKEEMEKSHFALEKYVKRFYFVNESGETDELGRSIDCWEQVLYQALRDYDVDYEFAFCDDINLVFTRGKEKLILEKESIYPNQALFHVCEWDRKEDGIAVIENLVRNKKMVAVATMFDMLVPYFWYDESSDGRYSEHYSMIVGYDDAYFYVVDSPDVLVKERDKKHPANKTIHLIEKEQYRRAMDKFCEIKTIDVVSDKLKEMKRLKQILPSMVRNFYEEEGINADGDTRYCGKRAIVELIASIKSDQDYVKLEAVFRDFPFQCHLLFSRRLLLKWCMEKDEKYIKVEYLEDIISELDNSIHHWKTLKYIIEKNIAKPISDFRGEIIKCLEEILVVEKRLFEGLRKVV